MRYITLAERIARRVFGSLHLPDAEGRFLLPSHLYGSRMDANTHIEVPARNHDDDQENLGPNNVYQLKLHHCLISSNQRRRLDLNGDIGLSKRNCEGGNVEGENTSDTLVDHVGFVDMPSNLWEMSEELTALGVPHDKTLQDQSMSLPKGVSRLLACSHPSITEHMEAVDSYAIDMALLDSSDEDDVDGNRKNGSSLISFESIMKAQEAMGLRFGSDVSSNNALNADQHSEDESNPGSQLFFSQNIHFDEGTMDDIENNIILEGQEARHNVHTNSNETSQLNMPSPICDSQQDFLDILVSQNESNKNAKSFVPRRIRSQEYVQSKDNDDMRSNLDESEIATQPQSAYVSTPSPSEQRLKNTSKRSRGKINDVVEEDSPRNKRQFTNNRNGKNIIPEATQENYTYSSTCTSASREQNRNYGGYTSSIEDMSGNQDESEDDGQYVGRKISKLIDGQWFSGEVKSYSRYG